MRGSAVAGTGIENTPGTAVAAGPGATAAARGWAPSSPPSRAARAGAAPSDPAPEAGPAPVAATVPAGRRETAPAPATTALHGGVLYDIAPAGEGAPGGDYATLLAAERLRGRFVYRAAKRAFDVAFSLAVLLGFCWLFLAVAAAVKLEDPSAPVLYRQRRCGGVGPGGEPRYFTMYKFRSMVPGADARLAELGAMNEKDGPVFKIADDPRVTRVGRAIRKTSVDELPQFVNVLRGDISVVGPRPALPSEVAAYDAHQGLRLLAKPGITCLWQTRRNRDSITFSEWVDLDLLYIRKCGVLTDLKLIVQTVGVVLTAQGS